MDLNLPKLSAFLCCHKINQDVLNKNYELLGVFQGFTAPGYPLGVEFLTFSRFVYEGEGEFQIDISLFNEKGEKISDSMPRKINFKESPFHDVITAWRLVFPQPGIYVFKTFCNNLNLSENKLYCR